MSRKAPGKAHRKGLSLLEIADMFRDNDDAREWIESVRWPDGPHCPKCGSFNVQSGIAHKTMTHRCRDCMTGKSKTMFTVRIGTVMEGTKLPYRAWAVGIYLMSVNLKGISSMQLHRELKIGQKAAWFMLHRLRLAMEETPEQFAGPVEADETYVGGKFKNMHADKRREARQKPDMGKTIVAGVKDRPSKRVSARVVASTEAATLHPFVTERTTEDATVYTDEGKGYSGLPRERETVKHSAGEYVKGDASTNGMEAFWSMLKRGKDGIYHKFSPKHLDRYVTEFAGRHNARDADTIDQMSGMVAGMAGKRLRYSDLIADNGLDSGARS